MYVEEIKLKRGRKTYRTVLIRESYRHEGKVLHRTICNISKLPPAVIEQIRRGLRPGSPPEPGGTLVVERSREYGASCALLSLARELGLDKLIYSRKEPWRENALALIAGRVVYQGSKLSLVNIYADTALWELCGHPALERPDVDEDAYEVMDKLLDRQDSIQKSLAAGRLQDGCLIYYDMTSSYFEGEYEGSDLVTFGYNRDGKKGHEQIAVGLLTDSQGCPVAVEVFRGNTSDQSTVLEQARRVSQQYGIKDVVFAGDRGMLTPKRIEEVSALNFKTLTALTHPQIAELLERKVVQLDLFDERQTVEVRDPDTQTLRYLLCKNPKTAAEERATRQALIGKTRQALEKLAVSRKKRTEQDLCAQAGAVLAKWRVAKFFSWTINKGRLEFEINQDLVQSEEALDGCYIIRTDVSAQVWPAQVAVDRYRGLAQVERAFRNLKTVALEMRPVYHHKDDRIRAHVFLCMLAYYLQWHALQRLQPLFDKDGAGKDRRWTWPVVLEQLKSIRTQTCRMGRSIIENVISRPDPDQQHILDLLKVKL
jgi:transposase